MKVNMFQFLMVQLKGGGENGEKYYYTMFQFLMVQLKERPKDIITYLQRRFNSLWYN